MNRRSFLSAMLKAGTGAFILPSAGRIWRPAKAIVNPVAFWHVTARAAFIADEGYKDWIDAAVGTPFTYQIRDIALGVEAVLRNPK